MSFFRNNEFLFVLYMFMFIIIRPISYFISYTKVILAVTLILILILSFFSNLKKKKDKYTYVPLSFALTIFILFLLDIIFRQNAFTIEHSYYYIIFGIVSVYLFTFVTNYERVLKYYYKFSIILFFVFSIDPFLDYSLSGGYMSFGYLAMLPVFFGIHIGYKIFKKKFLLILEIIALIELLFFANRGAFLAAILFIILIDLFTSKVTIRKILKYLSIILFGIIIWFNILTILEYFILLLSDYDLFSYSLKSYYNSIVRESTEVLFSGRLDIWSLYLEMFLEKPIFGYGVGAFEDKYGFYTHNLFFDISIFWGFIVLIIFLILILKGVYGLFVAKGHFKVLGILFFVQWFPMLLLSRQFTESYGFWLFISFGLLVSKCGLRAKKD